MDRPAEYSATYQAKYDRNKRNARGALEHIAFKRDEAARMKKRRDALKNAKGSAAEAQRKLKREQERLRKRRQRERQRAEKAAAAAGQPLPPPVPGGRGGGTLVHTLTYWIQIEAA